MPSSPFASRALAVSSLALLLACGPVASSSSSHKDAGHDGGGGGGDGGSGSDGGAGADGGGGSDGGGSADGGSTLSFADFCAQATAATLARTSSCMGGPLADYQTDPGMNGTHRCAALARGIAAGRIGYDATAAATCLSLIGSASCADLYYGDRQRNPANSCAKVLTGTVAAGGGCYRTEDCAAGAFCDQTGGCPAKCVAYVAAGGTCGSGLACAPGLYYDTAGGSCVCRTLATQGQSCGGTGEVKCAESLYCGPGNTCVPYLAKGASCQAAQSDTSSSLLCVIATGQTTGTCGPRAKIGASCGATIGCEPFAACVNGTCAEYSPQGGPCGYIVSGGVYDYRGCVDGWCDDGGQTGTVGVCKPYVAVGGSCMSGARCDPYATCSSGGSCLASCDEP